MREVSVIQGKVYLTFMSIFEEIIVLWKKYNHVPSDEEGKNCFERLKVAAEKLIEQDELEEELSEQKELIIFLINFIERNKGDLNTKIIASLTTFKRNINKTQRDFIALHH